MSIFEIDPDIRRARTLPSSFYRGTEMFERAAERIFRRTWQFAGVAEGLNPLDPLWLLPGVLDAPILRVSDGSVRKCISNVCTHRAKILVDYPCEAGLIRCPYHGRRFDLNGKLLSMPEFEEVEGFPSAEDDLAVIPSAERAGILFAALDPIAPLEDFFDEPMSIIGDLSVKGLRMLDAKGYTFDAHWALYCENYLEGFHIPFVHPTLNQTLNYGKYTTETFRYSSLQTGYDENGEIAGRYLFIFPNLMLNFYSWGVSINVVRPKGPNKTSVNFLTYVADPSSMSEGAGADLHGVEMEDEAIVESVQEGVNSPFYDRGRYSPTREQGTHHFHRLIAEFMG